MDRRFTLQSPEFPEIVLRTIDASDLENLRTWKNAHRESFFFKGVISPADQAKWFQGYLERAYDYMFVVVVGGQSIGCLAFRFIEGAADIYNVILGVPEMGRKGRMSKALRLMCSYIQECYPGRQAAKVLLQNPALGWYQRNSFKTVQVHEDYAEAQLNPAVFKSCRVIVNEKAAQQVV